MHVCALACWLCASLPGSLVGNVDLADNDGIAALISAATGTDLLMLMSNVDGVYTTDPSTDVSAKRIRNFAAHNTADVDLSGTSLSGRGGMASKVRSTPRQSLCLEERRHADRQTVFAQAGRRTTGWCIDEWPKLYVYMRRALCCPSPLLFGWWLRRRSRQRSARYGVGVSRLVLPHGVCEHAVLSFCFWMRRSVARSLAVLPCRCAQPPSLGTTAWTASLRVAC